MQRRSLVNAMLSGWAILGLCSLSVAAAGEPLRVTPAVQTVTAGQPGSSVQLTGWRHGWGYYGGGFYGGGWGYRSYYAGFGGPGYGYAPYGGYAYAPYGAYWSGYPSYAVYRPYPVATYGGPYYGGPYAGGAYYSAAPYSSPYYYGGVVEAPYAGPYAVGYAPAYSLTYRPYWRSAYYGPSAYYYGGSSGCCW
jgi:hypothetical protein